MRKKKEDKATEKIPDFNEKLLEVLKEQTDSMKKIESLLTSILEILQPKDMSGSVLEEIRSELSSIKYGISSMKTTLEKLEWKTLW